MVRRAGRKQGLKTLDQRLRRLSWVLWGAWIMTTLARPACASVDNPVRAGEEALRSTNQPWYDVEQDQLRPISSGDAAEEPERAQYQASDRPAWDWNWNWGFSWLGQLFEVFAWGILFVLIGALIYALVRTYLNLAPMRTSNREATLGEEEFVTDQQRIENLPVTLRAPTGDFLAIAREHYEAGDFAAAIVYLFSYRLLQLDKAGYIRLTKGKTNRQYLMELRRGRDLEQLLGQTMSAFEDVFFGNHSLDRDRFERSWDQNDQFQLLIARAMG